MTMTFEWDAAKDIENQSKHGVSLAYGIAGFHDPDRIVSQDLRREYGEARFIMLAKIDDRVCVIVYTPRGAAIRLISVRKANDREQRLYYGD